MVSLHKNFEGPGQPDILPKQRIIPNIIVRNERHKRKIPKFLIHPAAILDRYGKSINFFSSRVRFLRLSRRSPNIIISKPRAK